MDYRDVIQFIQDNFTNISHEFPWEDTPNASIFRHTDNHKWFALLMRLQYSTLNIDQPGEVYILNLKSDPDLIEELINQSGFLPAYHMNKTHWLTILLDHTTNSEQIKPLIFLSYQLTAKKYHQKPPSML